MHHLPVKICLLCLIVQALGHADSNHAHDHSKNLFDTTSEITDHDLEHLKLTTSKDNSNFDPKTWTRAQRQFYYFKQGDFDNNDKLDGIEMLQMMVKFEMEDDEYKTRRDFSYEDADWEAQLDKALENQDLNDDGMVSFYEFRVARENKRSSGF